MKRKKLGKVGPKPLRKKAGKEPINIEGIQNTVKGVLFIVVIGMFCLTLYKISLLLFQPIRNVQFHGNSTVSRTTLLKHMAIPNGTPFYQIDPYVLTRRLVNIAWIKSASVHKEFPSTLQIKVTERKPIAVLRTANGFFLVDEERVILEPESYPDKVDLPVIEDLSLVNPVAGISLLHHALQPAFELIQIFSKSEVLPLEAVSEIVLTDPMNIEVVTLPDGLILKLGHKNFEKRLENLQLVLSEVYKRREKIKALDLRYEHQVAAVLR